MKIEMNYKMVLNVLATAIFLVLYWLHRSDSVGQDGDHGETVQTAD